MARKSEKSINLTPRDPKKKKNEDKYSEIPTHVYKHDLKDKRIYTGLVSEHYGSECEVIKRGQKKSVNYYKVKLNDDTILQDVAEWFLKTTEEFELEQEQLKNKSIDSEANLSQLEREIIEKGLEPYKNRLSCFNQNALYERRCHECNYEDRCIFVDKYNYDKIKYN